VSKSSFKTVFSSSKPLQVLSQFKYSC